MTENQEYTQRELEHFFRDLRSDLDEKHQEHTRQFSDLLVQAKITNGRVSKLENWRWAMIGGIAVLSAIVVPILLNLIQK